jgi:Fic family protein
LVAVRRASTRYPHYRAEAIVALQVVLATGPTARGDFVRIMGIPERSAQRTLSQLVKDGLLVSDGPKSPVRSGFPLDALNILFPNLYPEAATVNPDA